MPSTYDLGETPRRELHIFYILDTSGSMSGTPIATLNRAVSNTIDQIKQQADSNADALIKIAVMEFNSGFKWLQPRGPEELADFYWQPLEAGGLTDMGAALKELDSKLSRDAFLSSMTGAYLPVIIFMTDGYATDDYKKALEQIRQNKWFNRGTKIGFAVGDEADVGMIAEIVGNSEAVIQTTDLELFARMFRYVSVTSSMLCSTSRTSADAVSAGDIVKRAKKEFDMDFEEKEENPDSSDGKEKESTAEPEEDFFEWENAF